MCTNLTCSDTSSVVPASSTHLPKKSSPRKGFKGFFSLPNFSLRLAYCCFSVLRNHFSTSNARLWGSSSFAGAVNIVGCSAQYEENSTNDVDERMNGGAVRDESYKNEISIGDRVESSLLTSPEKLAIDLRNALQLPRFCADTPAPSFSFVDILCVACSFVVEIKAQSEFK